MPDQARHEAMMPLQHFWQSPRARYILPGALVVLGGVLRVWGLTFGLPFTGAHPDETKFVSIGLGFGYGDLNPHFFGYPSLLFYLTSAAFAALYAGGHFLGCFPSLFAFKWQFFTDPSPFYVAARLLPAGLGTLTVLFAYRLGAALAGRPAGLLAALVMATNPLHVRNSHFATSDVPMAAFVTLALYHGVRASQRGALRDFLRAGICYGLAASTKYPAVLFLPALLGASLWPEGKAGQVPARVRFGRLGLGLAGAAVALILTSPYLLLDWTAAVRDVHYLSGLRGTGWFGDPGEPAWRYHLDFSLYYGLGFPLLAVLVACLTRLVARRERAALSVCAGTLAYFAFMGAGRLAFSRYMVPVIPPLCALVGTLAAWPKLREVARTRNGRLVLTCGLALVLALPLYRVIQQDWLFARADTRLVARDWILAHVPSGATLARVGSPFQFSWLEVPLSRTAWEKTIASAGPRGGGLTGWRTAREMLAAPGFPPGPSYTVLDGRRLSDVVPASGSPLYVAIQEHSLKNFADVHPEDRRTLERDAALLWEINPERGAAAVYERHDGIFLPFARFGGVTRPGPAIRIYRLP
ncbi:MAG TPA: glycosyltransferase family 39 protein [Candidatus Acidoferrum sp.]|nr:glycosyltransferase family 39 protein [Candidatus Acidoferrum sp.]